VAARDFVRKLQRRDRLEERVDRPAEEPCPPVSTATVGRSKLLAGGGRLEGRAPAPLLLADGLGQLLALTWIRLRSGDRHPDHADSSDGWPAKNGARPPNEKA
jgi:hypothetical protein